jgi:hypothetical protein
VAEDIIRLLEVLRAAGISFIESNSGVGSETRLYKILEGKVGTAVVGKEDLATIIKMDESFSMAVQARFIRLQDTSDGGRSVSPLIYLDGDFSQENPRLSIQLILAAHDASGDESQCLLLRFESPESADPAGKGKHDYYHSQLCKDLRKTGPNDTFAVPASISWPALSCPALPLDAQTPTHLLACLIYALYGKIEGATIMRRAYGEKFAERLSGMHFAFPLDAPRKAKGARRRR